MLKPKKIDIVSVVSQNSRKRFQIRICLNAAEIGIGAEIIDRAKLIREKINSNTEVNKAKANVQIIIISAYNLQRQRNKEAKRKKVVKKV